MKKQILPLFLFLIGLLLAPTARAQTFSVLYPANNTIFQRSPASANVRFVLCNQSYPLTTVQMRFKLKQIPGGALTGAVDPRPSGGSISADGWITVATQNSPIFNQYFANLDIKPGMYQVEVSQDGNTPVLISMGVGEVFVIAGQSNAAGYSKKAPGSTVKESQYETGISPFVQFINDKDSFEDSDPGNPRSSDVGGADFQWYWGGLGNKLINQLNVPVAFYQTAFSSTSISEWIQSANNNPTNRFPTGVPYNNLAKILTGKARETGVRAVLWLQGENDNLLNTSGTDYERDLRNLILFTRNNARGLNNGDNNGNGLAWVIARASHANGSPKAAITDAQTRLIGVGKNYGDPTRTPDGLLNIFAGPNTDQFGNDRRLDQTHFNQQGQALVAQEWFNALTQGSGNGQNFFGNSTPSSRSTTPNFNVCSIITGTGDCDMAIGIQRSGGTLCGQSVTLTATCSGYDCYGSTYSWRGNGLNITGQQVTFNLPNANGEYTYTLVVDNPNCRGKVTATTYNITNCSSTQCNFASPVRVGTWNNNPVQIRQYGSRIALVVLTDPSNDTHFPRGDNFWDGFAKNANVEQYRACLNAGITDFGGLAFPTGVSTPSGYATNTTGDGARYFYINGTTPVQPPTTNPCDFSNGPQRIGTWNNLVVQIRQFPNGKVALVDLQDAGQDLYYPRGNNHWDAVVLDSGVSSSLRSCLNVGDTDFGGLYFPASVTTPSGYSSGTTNDGARYFVRNGTTPVQPPTGSSSCYEAENFAGNRSVQYNSTASGGAYTGGFGTTGEFSVFTVNAPSAGNYTLNVSYATYENPTMGIVVNNGNTQPLYAPSNSSWGSQFAVVGTTVYLNAGSNTVRIQGGTGGSFYMDKICLQSGSGRIGVAEQEINVKQSVAVTPNPADSWFIVSCYVASGQKATVKISNLLGREIISDSIVGADRLHSIEFKSSDWPSGVYVINVLVDKQAVAKRLVIVR